MGTHGWACFPCYCGERVECTGAHPGPGRRLCRRRGTALAPGALLSAFGAAAQLARSVQSHSALDAAPAVFPAASTMVDRRQQRRNALREVRISLGGVTGTRQACFNDVSLRRRCRRRRHCSSLLPNTLPFAAAQVFDMFDRDGESSRRGSDDLACCWSLLLALQPRARSSLPRSPFNDPHCSIPPQAAARSTCTSCAPCCVRWASSPLPPS